MPPPIMVRPVQPMYSAPTQSTMPADTKHLNIREAVYSKALYVIGGFLAGVAVTVAAMYYKPRQSFITVVGTETEKTGYTAMDTPVGKYWVEKGADELLLNAQRTEWALGRYKDNLCDIAMDADTNGDHTTTMIEAATRAHKLENELREREGLPPAQPVTVKMPGMPPVPVATEK